MKQIIIAALTLISLGGFVSEQAYGQVDGISGQDDPLSEANWDVDLGMGMIYVPKYEGSGRSSFEFLTTFDVTWNDTVFVKTGDMDGIPDYESFAVGVNAFNSGNISAYGGLNYRFKQSSKTTPLKARKNAGDAMELFAGVTYAADFFKVDLTLYQGTDAFTNKGHSGLLVDAGVAFGARLSTEIDMLVRVGMTWGSKSFNTAYFGITQADLSANSEYVKISTPGQSLKDINLAGVVNYRLGSGFGVRGIAEFKRIVGDPATSPLVKKLGDTNQLIFGAQITYAF